MEEKSTYQYTIRSFVFIVLCSMMAMVAKPMLHSIFDLTQEIVEFNCFDENSNESEKEEKLGEEKINHNLGFTLNKNMGRFVNSNLCDLRQFAHSYPIEILTPPPERIATI